MKFSYEVFKTMLLAQHKLNAATSGDNYLTGTAKNGKDIDWELYIKMELAELINSLPHKHWAKVTDEIDFDNIKIELIDILHFTLSVILEQSYAEFTVKQNEEESIADDSDNTKTKKVFDIETFLDTDSNNPDGSKNIREALFAEDTNIMDVAYNFIYHGTIKTEESIYKIVDTTKTKEFTIALFKNWFKTLSYATAGGYHLLFVLGAIEYLNKLEIFSIEDAITVYFGKGTLNLFRQNHGYKEGTYIKMWVDADGKKVEDNVIMMDTLTKMYISNIIDVTSVKGIEKFQSELYIYLDEHYTAMLS